MDEGIDTGNILKIKKIRLDDVDRYEDIEDALEYHMPDFTMKTILEINKSIHKETLQNQDEGKQYFSIKDQKLIKKAKQKFTNFKVVGR
jgi:methionyl-tRNA formyltransferase